MASDGQNYQCYSPVDGFAVIIGVSGVGRGSSRVYCLEVLRRGEITGDPFPLDNQDGDRIWENKQLRNARITQGSLIGFRRKSHRRSANYTENTGKIWDISKVLSKLQSGRSFNAAVYPGIAECFPSVEIENLKIRHKFKDVGNSVCALISVKEATIVDGQVRFKTQLDEECTLKNYCQNNMGCGVEEVILPVKVSSSKFNTVVSNCVLLVKLREQKKSECRGSDRYYATCEAILGGFSLKSYEMKSNPRGRCIIINNLNFQNEDLNRPGAELDEKALKALFGELLFDVQIYRNLESTEIRKLVFDIAKEDHSNSDAFFFIGMSHGGNHDTILGVDQRSVTVEEIMSEFKAERCKTLESKAKVFIFQACRGSSSDYLVHETHDVDNTVGRHCVDSTLARGTSPQEVDFLVAFGTAPGYFSHRYEDHGTPFIQTLVDVIREHHRDTHLTEMLSEVARRVVKKPRGEDIQVPCYSNSLRAKLYLRVDNFAN